MQLTRNNNYRAPTNSSGMDDLEYSTSSTNNDLQNQHYVIPNEERTWRLSIDSVNFDRCCTKYQTRIQMDKVPSNVLKYVQIFYICERCGKVYWNGSHLERTFNGIMKDLIVHV